MTPVAEAAKASGKKSKSRKATASKTTKSTPAKPKPKPAATEDTTSSAPASTVESASTPAPVKSGAAMVLGKPISRKDEPKLLAIVLSELLYHYAQEHKIEPTPEEITAYLQSSAGRDLRLREEWRRELKTLEEELASPALTDADRRQKQSRIETIRGVLSQEDESSFLRQTYFDETRSAEQEIARQALMHWKVNQALFARYGGRVIQTRNGPVPLEAQRAFLVQQEREGAFRIPASARTSFWKRFTAEPTDPILSDAEAAEAMRQMPAAN
jgi:hypothetical protein